MTDISPTAAHVFGYLTRQQFIEAQAEEKQKKFKNRVCKTCGRDTKVPMFDGCMTPNCPRGYKPCL